MFRLFISSKQNKLLVEIKKRCDNSYSSLRNEKYNLAY